MEILEVSVGEYSDVIHTPYHIFGKADFNNLNRKKVDNVYYLLFKDGKNRLGLIAGSQGGILRSPFSAPFGGFSFITGDIRLQYIEESINVLSEWASRRDFSSIAITLPPSYYDQNFITKQISCLYRRGFEFAVVELNYSFNIYQVGVSYKEKIWRNARKNLSIACNANLQFVVALNDGDRKICYDIIARNRDHRGFPLRMTWEQILATIQIIPSDFFLVKNITQIHIASAIVFHITEKVVQVVYWGDLPGYTALKPMNYISLKIVEYYQMLGKEHIDIGHSTENSVPNYGLCEFKESIGSSINPRFTMSRSLV